MVYELDNLKKRAVGFKLSDGMDVPAELEVRVREAEIESAIVQPL